MKLLALYLAITLIGYLVGSKLRKRNMKIKWVGKIQTIAIIVLITLMGCRLGANSEVVKNIPSYGLTALIITIFAMAGSVAAIVVVRKALGINRQGVKTDD